MAMRPPVGLPTMSKRAKRVLIALVSLAVLGILWFQFVGIYVDWLWFGEVGFREVFTTQAISRIIMFLIAGHRRRWAGLPVAVPGLQVPAGLRADQRGRSAGPVPDDRHHPAEALRLRHLRCRSR